MAITGMNHFNVLTDDVPRTVAFYCDVLGLREGDRPGFDFPGAWLYQGDSPIVHISGGRPHDELKSGVIDHVAFSARDLRGTLARLERAGIRALTRRQVNTGIWQVFIDDPNGARVELDFSPEEAGPA
ncbi:MAG TPA: VOC family protein [Casimicrobiaceae bacterium]|nr:VOC family protein [Casimicrobiaceae bacterium]